jgi:hypothetical protein
MAGRPKGARNKYKLLSEYIGGPRDAGLFLLQVLEDEAAPMDARIDAAKTLLPYQHKKMPVDNSVDLKLPDNITISIGHAHHTG